MNKDLKHYAAFIFFQGARIVLATLAMAVLARYLGPVGLGRWTLITAAATLFHLLSVNWLQQDSFLRFAKREWARHETVRHTWGARIPLALCSSAIMVIVFALVPKGWFQYLFPLVGMEWILAAGFFFSLLISIECQTFLQIIGAMPRLALGPALIALLLAPFYIALWASPLQVYRLGISFAGTVIITITTWIILVAPKITFSIKRISWDRELAGEIFSFAWPILPSTMLGYIVTGKQIGRAHV